MRSHGWQPRVALPRCRQICSRLASSVEAVAGMPGESFSWVLELVGLITHRRH
jgi:hypothetical protein